MDLRIDPIFGRVLEQFVEHSRGVLAPRRVHTSPESEIRLALWRIDRCFASS